MHFTVLRENLVALSVGPIQLLLLNDTRETHVNEGYALVWIETSHHLYCMDHVNQWKINLHAGKEASEVKTRKESYQLLFACE